MIVDESNCVDSENSLQEREWELVWLESFVAEEDGVNVSPHEEREQEMVVDLPQLAICVFLQNIVTVFLLVSNRKRIGILKKKKKDLN